MARTAGAHARPLLVLATTNRHKIAEFGRLWRGLPLALSGMDAFPGYAPPAEDGVTYAANAAIKARSAALYSGHHAVADDSGLEVDALDGRPGMLSARYAGGADAPIQRRALLDELVDTPDGRRQARFVCALVLCAADGRVLAESIAAIAGYVTRAEDGAFGFGYDPIFRAYWMRSTMARVPPAVKDAVSHRGRAAAMLRPHLERLAMNLGAPDPGGTPPPEFGPHGLA